MPAAVSGRDAGTAVAHWHALKGNDELRRVVQAARTLLTLDDKEVKRLFEGEALLRRMYKYGLLEEGQNKLDYVLALTPQARPL